jgi:hypothetical protein
MEFLADPYSQFTGYRRSAPVFCRPELDTQIALGGTDRGIAQAELDLLDPSATRLIVGRSVVVSILPL